MKEGFKQGFNLIHKCSYVDLIKCMINSFFYSFYANHLKTFLNSRVNLDSAENLFGLNKRFTKINGAPSKEQMIWLESILEKLRVQVTFLTRKFITRDKLV